jgi:hypothetical protein
MGDPLGSDAIVSFISRLGVPWPVWRSCAWYLALSV